MGSGAEASLAGKTARLPSIGMKLNSIKQCRPVLGTYVEIELVAEADDNALLDLSLAAFAEIERIERLMSFHDEESELSRINRRALQETCRISAEMEAVLRFALDLSRKSSGRYDLSIAPELVKRGVLPGRGLASTDRGNWEDLEVGERTVRFGRPLQLDLGGIGKGYAVDRALAVLGDEVDAVVNAGGDLRMTHWERKTVGIKIPRRNGGVGIFEMPMLAPAVATSASYYLDGEQVILSPDTGKPVQDARSVSVFAETCMEADALTKIVFLAPDCGSILKAMNARAVLVDESGVVTSPGS